MKFAPVPSESKSRINRAGKILAWGNRSGPQYQQALDLAERWRACHAYPINTFQATLRTRLRSYPVTAIAAQRLKRMPTIIDKLKRYPKMQLTTMQDIAGVRAILPSVGHVYRLVKRYKGGKSFRHNLINEKDYIQEPRSEDGYRSAHLIYSYRNQPRPGYDGLRIELQIRTRLQHVWATAVESMGTFLGQALKSRQGDQEWLDFFALVSSAFAHREKTTPIPRFAELSPYETSRAVAKGEHDLGALSLMNGLSIAANAIQRRYKSNKGWYYHLIVLRSLKREVQITAYDRESLEEAVRDYEKAEERARADQSEPVLVSAGPLDRLRTAYPNFFLDITQFVHEVSRIVNRARNSAQ